MSHPPTGPDVHATGTGPVRQDGGEGVHVASSGPITGNVSVRLTRHVVQSGLLSTIAAIAVGGPVLAVTLWRERIEDEPAVSLLVLAVWLVAISAGGIVLRLAVMRASRRLDQVYDAVDLALGRQFSRYGRRYRTWVHAGRRYMESRGLATVGDFTPELDEVFVDVSLAPRPPHLVSSGVLGDVPADVVERHALWDLIGRETPAVLAVVGVPGSGKTTLLRYVARRIAQTKRQRRPVPVLVTLRDHATRMSESTTTTLPQLVRAALPTLPVGEPAGWWEDQLERGRCVVLLDGLDEVADPEVQRQLAVWLNRQISIYPLNDYVITSRPHGYHGPVLDRAWVFQVRPFTDGQISQFLHGWYLAVERRATGGRTAEVDELVRESVADLLDRLAGTEGLYELAINPLLLTMIANVHRYRGALPNSRADLYGEMCEVMLWRRDEAKRLTQDLPGPSKERLLAQLAFAMSRDRLRELPRTGVLAVFRRGLKRLSSTVDADGFLADVGSNGLLVEHEKDRYMFAHLTFQEYLAARHIRDTGQVGVLLDAVDDPWWRETTVLYVAGADADEVVRACLASRTTAALSLAYGCLEMGLELAPDLREQLDKVRTEALSPAGDSDQRLLVAQVLANRHLRRHVITPHGTLLCAEPVPVELYQLFLRSNAHARPDGPSIATAKPSEPVSGVRASDVAAFVRWMNSVAGTDGILCRLPTGAELDSLTAGDGPARRLLGAWVRNVWVQDRANGPELWTWPGTPAANMVRGADIRAVVEAELADSRIPQHLAARFMRQRLRTLSQALAEVRRFNEQYSATAAWSNTLRYAEKVRYNHAAAYHDVEALHRADRLVKAMQHDLGLESCTAAVRALVTVFAIADGEVAVLPVDTARGLVAGINHAADLVVQIKDRIQSAYEKTGELSVACGHLLSALDLRNALLKLLRRIGELAGRAARREPVEEILALDHLPDRASSAVDRVAAAMLGAVGDPVKGLAAAMLAEARLRDGQETTVRLDDCTSAIDTAVKASQRNQHGTAGWMAVVAARLEQEATPLFTRALSLNPERVATVRLRAIALAAEANSPRHSSFLYEPGAAADLRVVAAGVTLLEQRVKDPDRRELILLARA